MPSKGSSNPVHKVAVEEVENFFQHEEDLQRLSGLLQEYAHKQQVNKTQLTATVASQVDSIRVGMDLLEASQSILLKMQIAFRAINVLCAECTELLAHHEKIQLLSSIYSNLGKTLQDVEHIAALPHEAAEAEELLHDDYNLLQAYESLAVLEGTALLAQQTLHNKNYHDLHLYFGRVKATMQKLEDKLWSIIRNFSSLGSSKPALLVNAVRVVELQEIVDRQAFKSNAVIKCKGYKHRCQDVIRMCIQEDFAPLLQSCAKLAATGEDTDKRISEILQKAREFVDQLADVNDFATPCFPATHKIFEFISQAYHNNFEFMLDCIGACAEQLANSDTLKVVEWVEHYQMACQNLGLEDINVQLTVEPSRGLCLLMDKYYVRTHAMLHTWFTNILQVDMSGQPRVADDGRLWTPGAVEFFRIVNEQISVVETRTTGLLLLRAAEAVTLSIKEFQAAQHTLLQSHLDAGLLCALVNNNARCYAESLQFAAHLNTILDQQLKGNISMEYECRGFVELAEHALLAIIAAVFSDQAFMDLFHKMYCSSEWSTGRITGTIVATLDDYLEEYQGCLDPEFFIKLAERCLEETFVYAVAALLTYLKSVTQGDLMQIGRDVRDLSDFFRKYVKQERVLWYCQPLADLKALLASDSVDSFVLSYTTILQRCPGLSMAFIERLIAARSDISKPDVREVLEQCKMVYQQQQRSSQAGPGGLAGGMSSTISNLVVSRDQKTSFSVALLAARKR